MDDSTRSLPKEADVLINAITLEESSVLKDFILSKLPDPGSVDLLYRPDEWDSAGVIQKIQDLAKDHISRNYVTYNQLEPRGFKLSRISDSSDCGEEYSEYNLNGEIVYQVTATVSNRETCIGGDTLYTHTYLEVPHEDGTTVVIHRDEKLNDWKISPIVSGDRLDLIIYIQEFDLQKSYDYPIDQITKELEDF